MLPKAALPHEPNGRCAMIDSEGSRSLRPLGIGELLDRSVSIGVRAFVPLALAYAAFAVLIGVLQFASGADLGHTVLTFTGAIDASRRGGAIDPKILAHALTAAQASRNPFASLLSLPVLLISPLPTAALIVFAARRALGERPTIAEVYRTALRRWLPLIGVAVLFFFVFGAVVVALVGISLVAVLVLVGIATVSKPVAIGAAIALALAVLIAYVVVGLLVLMAYEVAFCTCLIERVTVPTAVVAGLRRVFRRDRNSLARTLIVGIAYSAIVFAATTIGLFGQGLAVALAHSLVLGEVVQIAMHVVGVVFGSAFVAVYYLDLRVREDGFDLQLAARSLPATA